MAEINENSTWIYCILCDVKLANTEYAYNHYKCTIHQHRMHLDISNVDRYLVPCEKPEKGTQFPPDFTFKSIDSVAKPEVIIKRLHQGLLCKLDFDWDLERKIMITIMERKKESDAIKEQIRENNKIRQEANIESAVMKDVLTESEQFYIDTAIAYTAQQEQKYDFELMEKIQTEWLLKESEPKKNSYLNDDDFNSYHSDTSESDLEDSLSDNIED